MIASMGLLMVTCVVIFSVFNSGRAVNEKMNLVNAADATAYSGALVASRQLNFMAYTNRAMIANEVAIGHMVSFQAEVNLVEDALTEGLTGFPALLKGGIDYLIASAGGDPTLTVETWRTGMSVLAGSYILTVDATNALYADFQKEEYDNLAAINGQTSIADITMGDVASRYVKNPDVEITVNEEVELDLLLASDIDATLAGKINQAKSNESLCSFVMFASPSDATATNPPTNALNAGMTGYCSGGGAGNQNGTFSNPINDSGALLDLLNRSAEASTSSDWITNRNMNYNMGLILNRSVERVGATQVVWDTDLQQTNWVTGVDTIDSIPGFLGLGDMIAGIHGNASSNAINASFQVSDAPDWASNAVITLMDTLGMCGEIDCTLLAGSGYQGIKRFAVLNPYYQQVGNEPGALVTAVLVQKGNCNDLYGRNDKTGKKYKEWNDEITRTTVRCDGTKLTAVSQARVFYERPGCTAAGCMGFDLSKVISEKPNLYNPFWTAKLIY